MGETRLRFRVEAGGAFYHFALQHHDHFRQARALFDQSLQDCSRDVVGKVCNEACLSRRLDLAAKVRRERVAHNQFEVWETAELFVQRLHQREVVELRIVGQRHHRAVPVEVQLAQRVRLEHGLLEVERAYVLGKELDRRQLVLDDGVTKLPKHPLGQAQ